MIWDKIEAARMAWVSGQSSSGWIPKQRYSGPLQVSWQWSDWLWISPARTWALPCISLILDDLRRCRLLPWLLLSIVLYPPVHAGKTPEDGDQTQAWASIATREYQIEPLNGWPAGPLIPIFAWFSAPKNQGVQSNESESIPYNSLGGETSICWKYMTPSPHMKRQATGRSHDATTATAWLKMKRAMLPFGSERPSITVSIETS